MIAASVWSLLIPSIDMEEGQGKVAWIPAVIGFLFGIVFLRYSKLSRRSNDLCSCRRTDTRITSRGTF